MSCSLTCFLRLFVLMEPWSSGLLVDHTSLFSPSLCHGTCSVSNTTIIKQVNSHPGDCVTQTFWLKGAWQIFIHFSLKRKEKTISLWAGYIFRVDSFLDVIFPSQILPYIFDLFYFTSLFSLTVLSFSIQVKFVLPNKLIVVVVVVVAAAVVGVVLAPSNSISNYPFFTLNPLRKSGVHFIIEFRLTETQTSLSCLS